MTQEELVDKLVEGDKLMPYMERFEAEEVVNFILDNYSQEVFVSEGLEEAAEKCIESLIPETELNSTTPFALEYVVELLHKACKYGAKWQKEKLWKPADGDDLPEIDKEVIVLTQPYPLENSEYAVSFAHRPNPNGWDGKSVTTGKVEHYTPKTYDKGGWNIPNIMYWLDVELPKY